MWQRFTLLSCFLLTVGCSLILTSSALALEAVDQVVAPAISQENPLQASVSLAEQPAEKQVLASLMTNDPFYSNQWFLNNTGQKVNGFYGFPGADASVESAWEMATGRQQTIAVIDTGIVPHNDLVNKRVGGYNFVNPGASVYDDDSHGTIISGIIAAQANNSQGIAGIAYNSKVMPLKVSNGTETDLDYLTDAINYLKNKNVKITNISFGSSGYTNSFQNAIINNPQILFVVAAGNDAENNQNIPVYPCNLPMENIICVAASTQTDRLADWSNYGRVSVDLAAPGENIFSTVATRSYLFADGTSFAAPIVAAAAALIKEKHPAYTPVQVKQLLLGSVDKLPTLKNKTVTGGRLNVFKALTNASDSEITTNKPRLFIKRLRTRNSKTAKFWLASSQFQSKFECKIDYQRQWSGCSGFPLIINGKYLINGHHKLSVRAINKFGQSSNIKKISFFTNVAQPKIKKVIGKVISKKGKQRKVQVHIKIHGAKKIWCARSGYALRRCKANNWSLYLKKGNNRLLIKASNQYNNSSKALFNLKIK